VLAKRQEAKNAADAVEAYLKARGRSRTRTKSRREGRSGGVGFF